MTDDLISRRKKEHLAISLSSVAQTGSSGFERWRFRHNALPEIDFDEIDLTVECFGHTFAYPFFISSMTGGVAEGKLLNQRLMLAAQKHNIAMGVGSQRAAIECSEFAELYGMNEGAFLMANVGAVQLNYGLQVSDVQKAIEMIDAKALILHVNPLQEAIQPEGDRNFKNILKQIEQIVRSVQIPVIVKEVGFGISEDVCQRLYDVGVRYVDVAGWGGTSWAVVEGMRVAERESLGVLFGEWGIPTAASLQMCRGVAERVKEPLTLFASGGIRNGVEIAKAIALGGTMVGLAAPFGIAARESDEAIEQLIAQLALELKIAMFGIGVRTIEELRQTKALFLV